MPTATLTTLPDTLLRTLLQHLDPATLSALSETSRQLHAAISDESLWRHLLNRRYRPSSTFRSHRHRTISWRNLYANWHMQRRMPSTCQSGPSYPAFARGEYITSHGMVLVWGTVLSTDDSRLVRNTLRLRIVLQNVSSPAVCISLSDLQAVLTDGVSVRAGRRLDHGYKCSVSNVRVERVAEGAVVNRDGFWLRMDDVGLVVVDIFMRDAMFEVDALERLECLKIGVKFPQGGSGEIVARFRDRIIWENYERLPGGWWVRSVNNRSRG